MLRGMLEFFLGQQDMSLDTILKLASKRYDFPSDETRERLKRVIEECGEAVEFLPETGQYQKKGELCNITKMLEFMRRQPEEYFEGRPGLKRFFTEFQKEYASR